MVSAHQTSNHSNSINDDQSELNPEGVINSTEIDGTLNFVVHNNNFKSSFARSVVVHRNSDAVMPKFPKNMPVENCNNNVIDMNSLHASVMDIGDGHGQISNRKSSCDNNESTPTTCKPFMGKLEETFRTSFSGSSRSSISCASSENRRTCSLSSRHSELLPVETIVNHTKVETLQWQLKETEKSREMYRAVMKQVLTFLEKAHRNLEEHVSCRQQTVSSVRSRSEHEIGNSATDSVSNCSTANTFCDFTWRRSQKKLSLEREQFQPEKLSQEAFRLLRTVQSLLSTQEPTLIQSCVIEEDDADENLVGSRRNSCYVSEDFEFISQLAREFPPQPETVATIQNSYSLSPKLLLPERGSSIRYQAPRTPNTLNRKLSLQLNETRHHNSSYRGQRLLFNGDTSTPTTSTPSEETPTAAPVTPAIPGSNSSSLEDESGFSSMNSFQDVGVPILGSEEISLARHSLLRSTSANRSQRDDNDLMSRIVAKKVQSFTSHDKPTKSSNRHHNMKVLWV